MTNDDEEIILGYYFGKSFTKGCGTVPLVDYDKDVMEAVIVGDTIEKIFNNGNNENPDYSSIKNELEFLNSEMQNKMRTPDLEIKPENINNTWLEMNARAMKGTFPWLTEYNETIHWSHYTDGYGKGPGYAKQLLANHPDDSYVFDKKGKFEGHISPYSLYTKRNCGFPGNVPVLINNGEKVSETLAMINGSYEKELWKPICSLKTGDKVISWRKTTPRGYVISEVEKVLTFPKPSQIYDILFDNLPNKIQHDVLHVTQGQLLWTHHGWVDFGVISQLINQAYINGDPIIMPLLGLWGTPIQRVTPNPQLTSICKNTYNLVIKETSKSDVVDTFCVPYGIARSYVPYNITKKLQNLLS